MVKPYVNLHGMTPDGRSVCAFFVSPGGCRNGDKCTFFHGAEGRNAKPQKGDGKTKKSPAQERRAAKRSAGNAKRTHPAVLKAKAKKLAEASAKAESSDGNSSDDGEEEEVVTPRLLKRKRASEPTDSKVKKHVRTSVGSVKRRSSRDVSESESEVEDAVSDDGASSSEEDDEGELVTPASVRATPPVRRTPVSQQSTGHTSFKLHKEGKAKPCSLKKLEKWETLLQRTSDAPGFEAAYTMRVGPKWVQPRKCGDWCKGLPHLIAVDCEMCVGANPKASKSPKPSSPKGNSQMDLIRVSAVEGRAPHQAMLDRLVAPPGEVSDMVTRIHGISSAHLAGVKFKLKDAQKALQEICCSETILVGHSLDCDLKALKFQHYKVVDTALLFQLESSAGTPSLKDLVHSVLRKPLQGAHDSVCDARASMEVACHELANGPSPPVARAPRDAPTPKRANGGRPRDCSLRVHRLPAYLTAKKIDEMFRKKTFVLSTGMDDLVVGKSGTSSTSIHFMSAAHAKLAFSTLEGSENKDALQRRQKKVLITAGSKEYVQVGEN